ncbi:MAG: MFS transporter [Gemmataceae bacterium]|nr:MFS transporter [Gemmata sp.]MDW8199115.1 MFS transporter [Gemmataceae bacterium]
MNRTVLGAGLTSFFADFGYEMATAILPGFLLILGLPPDFTGRVLGVIEGVADLLANAVKLLIGWYSDRIGHRKAFVVGGYALTGSAFALCALAVGWPLVFCAKSLAWIGKGLRGPLRNAILADAVDEANRGKAFGFHRAGDTLGAIVGPLAAAGLIALLPHHWFEQPASVYRWVFLITLIPGLGAAITFAALIREQRFTPKPGLRFSASLRLLPRRFWRFLAPVLVFGIGDFSHTLLIFVATVLLTPTHGVQEAATLAGLLYAWKNAAGAIAAFPAGWLGDHFGRRQTLAGGYALGAVVMMGLAALSLAQTVSLGWLVVLFGLAGVYLAVEEALEPALTADLVPDASLRGTGMGVLATVNGIGDFLASIGFGLLFALGAEIGLSTAAIFMASGAVLLIARKR